jgi:hypothetical protein
LVYNESGGKTNKEGIGMKKFKIESHDKTTKSFLIKITTKHLKNSDYLSNTHCPLAKALRSRGYSRICVGGYSVEAYRNKKHVMFKIVDSLRLATLTQQGRIAFTQELQEQD